MVYRLLETLSTYIKVKVIEGASPKVNIYQWQMIFLFSPLY